MNDKKSKFKIHKRKHTKKTKRNNHKKGGSVNNLVNNLLTTKPTNDSPTKNTPNVEKDIINASAKNNNNSNNNKESVTKKSNQKSNKNQEIQKNIRSNKTDISSDDQLLQISYNTDGDFKYISDLPSLSMTQKNKYNFQDIPYIKLSSNIHKLIGDGNKYVLLMIDTNSVIPSNSIGAGKDKAIYVHMIVMYQKTDNDDVTKSGLVILPYKGPTPPKNTGEHTYKFNLYKVTDTFDLNPDISSILTDKYRRTIHSEQHDNLDYLKVLIGMSSGNTPVSTQQFVIDSNQE